MADDGNDHVLGDFMSQLSHQMESEYIRIQKRVHEDPGTAGDEGEENWAELLRDWLPPTYTVVTKGRLIGCDGRMSRQIDILVLDPTYPRKLHNKKIYLSEGVLAAFECKITLKSKHIRESIRNCVGVKSLFPVAHGSPYVELHSPIIYGLLAHSHEWKDENSNAINNIENKLQIEDASQVNHPRNVIDVLCVADLACWYSSSGSWYKSTVGNDLDDYSVCTAYIGQMRDWDNQITNFTPIGSLIANLSYKIAWRDKSFRKLAEYYHACIRGTGRGTMRMWKPDIYSNEVREKIKKGFLKCPSSLWDEWALGF